MTLGQKNKLIIIIFGVVLGPPAWRALHAETSASLQAGFPIYNNSIYGKKYRNPKCLIWWRFENLRCHMHLFSSLLCQLRFFSSELFYFTFQTAKKHLHTVKIWTYFLWCFPLKYVQFGQVLYGEFKPIICLYHEKINPMIKSEELFHLYSKPASPRFIYLHAFFPFHHQHKH
jgi:hypothetical protein